MNGSVGAADTGGTGIDRRSHVMTPLRRFGLLAPGETPNMVELSGGVSSDIWRVDLDAGPVCIKRALRRLKLAQVWEAPVERNANEAEWIRVVSERVPGCTVRLIVEDRPSGLFVMEYLEPGKYRLRKECLRAGEVDTGFAGQVGSTIAQIHAATAGDQTVACRFGSSDMFHALRLESYFIASARRHQRFSSQPESLVERTARIKIALVHGDVSPKNILVGASARFFSMRNVPGMAIRLLTWPSASTICC